MTTDDLLERHRRLARRASSPGFTATDLEAVLVAVELRSRRRQRARRSLVAAALATACAATFAALPLTSSDDQISLRIADATTTDQSPPSPLGTTTPTTTLTPVTSTPPPDEISPETTFPVPNTTSPPDPPVTVPSPLEPTTIVVNTTIALPEVDPMDAPPLDGVPTAPSEAYRRFRESGVSDYYFVIRYLRQGFVAGTYGVTVEDDVPTQVVDLRAGVLVEDRLLNIRSLYDAMLAEFPLTTTVVEATGLSTPGVFAVIESNEGDDMLEIRYEVTLFELR